MAWPENMTLNFLAWYAASSLCAVAEDDGWITAVVMGRPVNSLAQGRDERFGVDWNGEILWVQCAVSDEGMSRVWSEAVSFLARQGCNLTHVAWKHLRRNGKIVCQPLERVGVKIMTYSPLREYAASA